MDLNQRPISYEPTALTTELRPQGNRVSIADFGRSYIMTSRRYEHKKHLQRLLQASPGLCPALKRRAFFGTANFRDHRATDQLEWYQDDSDQLRPAKTDLGH